MASRAARQAVAIGLITQTARFVLSQQTTIECPAGMSWSLNSLNQNPCVVAGYLLGVCADHPTNITIDSTLAQSAPGSGLAANLCTCSTVTYAVMSSCALCSGVDQLTRWSSWSDSCADDIITLERLPFDVPMGTAVPAWAFQDVERFNVFDPETAANIHDTGQGDATPTNIVSQSSAAPSSVTDLSRTHRAQEPSVSGASSSSSLSATTSTDVSIPQATSETIAPTRQADSPVPVVAGVLGALAGVIAVMSIIALIIRRKGLMRPQPRKRPVPVMSAQNFGEANLKRVLPRVTAPGSQRK